MASPHQLAISKASLTAKLLRADPFSVQRDNIAHFHTLLEKALVTCTPANIQNCKRWILKNITSKQRIIALGKYLVALVQSFNLSTIPASISQGSQTQPSGKKKALHTIFLVNDLLYHKKVSEKDPLFAEDIKVFLPDLLSFALYPGAIKQKGRVVNVLRIWKENEYYDDEFLDHLRATCLKACSSESADDTHPLVVKKGNDSTVTSDTKVSSAPVRRDLRLPTFHGDPSLPYYDLPAGNVLPHIIPNSIIPVNHRLVRPIQFRTTTPSENLSKTVQTFLSAVESMFGEGNIAEAESDAVGGVWGKAGEGYYGWSREFCDKMKEKKRAVEDERRRGRSPSEREDNRMGFGRPLQQNYSRNHSRSDSPGNRRGSSSRYSGSRSRSRSGPRRGGDIGRNRGRDRTMSRSRSPKPRSPAYHSRSATPEQLSLSQRSQETVYPNYQGFPPPAHHYGMQQQSTFMFPAAPPLAQFPPHIQNTALFQQFMMQQQMQQYAFPPGHPAALTTPHPMIHGPNPVFGGTNMPWPPPPPLPMNYAQQSQESQQQPPSGPNQDRGYGY